MITRTAQSQIQKGMSWWTTFESLDEALRWHDSLQSAFARLVETASMTPDGTSKESFSHATAAYCPLTNGIKTLDGVHFGIRCRTEHEIKFLVDAGAVVIMRVAPVTSEQFSA